MTAAAYDRRGGQRSWVIHDRYRKAGGKRLRLIADFLIGAHAAMRATRLATKDDGFFRAQFRKLSVVRPA